LQRNKAISIVGLIFDFTAEVNQFIISGNMPSKEIMQSIPAAKVFFKSAQLS